MSVFPNKQVFLDPDRIALERLRPVVMKRLEAIRRGSTNPRRGELTYREVEKVAKVLGPPDSLIQLLIQELNDAGWATRYYDGSGWDERMIIIG